LLKTEKTMQCELVTWNQVCRLCARVAEKIRNSGFRPDVVVAIARGGYVPARILCDVLDLYALESIRVGHYEAGAQKIPKAQIYSPLPVDIRGRSVLLVDDCSDTGDTLQLALEHLRSRQPQDLKVAVLHHKEVSPVVPDFYGQRVLAWRWLIYPWAVTEDLSGFLGAMNPPPDSAEAAVRQLELRHGIRVSRRTVEDTLTAMRQAARR